MRLISIFPSRDQILLRLKMTALRFFTISLDKVKYVTKNSSDKFVTELSLKYDNKKILLLKSHLNNHIIFLIYLLPNYHQIFWYQTYFLPNWHHFSVLKINDTKFYERNIRVIFFYKFIVELSPNISMKNWFITELTIK